MNTQSQKTIDGEEVIQSFESSAKGYCSVIEQINRFSRIDFLKTIQLLLGDLYLRALSLPDVSPTLSDVAAGINHDEWARVFDSIVSKIGDRHGYWNVFEPIDPEDHESICCSLADDLADIYRDVNEGLLRRGEGPGAIEDVVWQWRFDFQNHWGHHAVSAIGAIHSMLYGPHAIYSTE